MQLTFHMRTFQSQVHCFARYLQSRFTNITSSEEMDVRSIHRHRTGAAPIQVLQHQVMSTWTVWKEL